MPKRFATLLIALLSLSPALSHAQDTQPTATRTSKFLAHFDLGVSGMAFFTKDVSGSITSNAPNVPYNLTQSASTAAGVLATIRAQKSAYKGLEFNYSYGRVTQSYTCCNLNASTGANSGPFATQTTAHEYTLGYLVRPPHEFFGVQPFISGGAGVYSFTPTKFGGQSLQTQARMTYYYHVGGEKMFSDHFGFRFGIRQLFYKAPDFDQNYLRIKKTTFTTEPEAGIFVHF
ncbi:outer membrane beta-barrel protein [Terriglobus sp. TAA 43]|uniref:outer membrane beta-barrel protein n=1 Tax=Terriglobus sp. TAA 43 TaxID=278961 RepID=UPI000647CEB5|nr:outer membrane beta-barrel protein [Terriglobus sp. TAA 43]